MSDRKASRAHKVYLHPPVGLRTLLDVKRALPSVQGLKPRACADCISALNTIGNLHRLLGEKPKDVDLALARMEADPRLIHKYLDRGKAARHGLTDNGGWNNIAYRVRKAFAVTGVVWRVGDRGARIDDERFYNLPKWHQAALGAFMRWRKLQQIPLEAVTSPIVENFGIWLEADPLGRKRPRSTLLATARALNSAAARFPQFWPPTFVKIAHKFKGRYVKEWEDLSPELKEEADCRRQETLNPDLNDPEALDPVKEVTADNHEYEIRRCTTALALQTGRDVKSITRLSDLVQIDSAGAIMQFLLKRIQEKEPAAQTSQGLFVVGQFLCNLAANWVKVDDDHLKRLRKIVNRRNPNPAARAKGQRKRRKHGMTRKNRVTLTPFRDEHLAARFLDLPEAIFDRVLKRAVKRKKLRRMDASTLACAFAIAFLQSAPVRPKNGAQPLLRKNIIEQGEGPSRRVFAHWEPYEVKNEAELHFELTGLTLRLFDAYMKYARPLLATPGNNYLFPGRGDGPKNEVWFSQQIAEMTHRELGVRVSGQQFRHLTGFLYLLAHRGDYETVRQFLGHASLSTTVNYYCSMEMEDAAKALDAATTKRREELAGKTRRSLRRRRG